MCIWDVMQLSDNTRISSRGCIITFQREWTRDEDQVPGTSTIDNTHCYPPKQALCYT
jgi:hypothetical protein